MIRMKNWCDSGIITAFVEGVGAMRDTYLLGNWKMCGLRQSNATLLQSLAEGLPLWPEFLQLAVFPPLPYLMQARQSLQGTRWGVGAQAVSEFESGAYTGEVAGEMLLDMGCRYVLIGHSERRKYFGENNDRISAKFWRAHDLGLMPVLCIGENEQQWQAGQTFEVLRHQLTTVFASGAMVREAIIAYEPVWAIGTGQSATPDYIATVHSFIRQCLASWLANDSDKVAIVYGGSLKAQNLADILAADNVDGGLVGAASLQADEFIKMAAIAAQKAQRNLRG